MKARTWGGGWIDVICYGVGLKFGVKKERESLFFLVSCPLFYPFVFYSCAKRTVGVRTTHDTRAVIAYNLNHIVLTLV